MGSKASGSDTSFWVAAKNLKNNKIEMVASPSLYCVFEDNTYTRFKPHDVNDFKSDLKYGRKNGEFMVFYYILAMAETEKEIRDRVGNADHPKRIRNPKRLSSSDSQRLLKDLARANEREGAKLIAKNATKKAKIQGHKSNEEAALKAFKKKSKIEPKKSDAKESPDQHKEAPPTRQPPQMSAKPDGAPTPPQRPTQHQHVLSHSVILDDLQKQPNSSVTNLIAGGDVPLCTGNCASITLLNQQLLEKDQIISDLKEKLLEKEKLLDNYNLEQLTTVKQLAADMSDLKAVKDAVQQINENIGSVGGNNPVGTLSMTSSQKSEISVPTSDGTPIPQGMLQVHIGENIFISLATISSEVELKTFDFNKRVAKMLQVFFPDDLQKRSLDPKSLGPDALQISPSNVSVMTRLLNMMAKKEEPNATDKKTGKFYTEDTVRSAVRRRMWAVREAAKFKSLPPEQQQEILKKRRERSRAARAAKAANGKKKTLKRKATLISSDSEESSEEQPTRAEEESASEED